MKSFYRNYFKEGKLYQWNEGMDIYSISNTPIQEEFCLDEKGMDTLLKFPNPTVKLGKRLQVKSGSLSGSISVIDAVLVLPNMKFDTTCKVEVDKLIKASKFVDKKARKPVLAGVSVRNNSIQATDSFFAYKSSSECISEIVLTVNFINEIDASGVVELKTSSNNVMYVKDDGTEIYGRLLVAKYPEIEKVFATMGTNTFEISKNELMSLISLSNDGEILFESDKIVLRNDLNEFTLDASLGIQERICITHKQLKQVLSLIDSDIIHFNYTDSKRPLFIEKEYLILPMKEVR